MKQHYLIVIFLSFFFACKKDPSFPQAKYIKKDSIISVSPPKPCNGFSELCNKKYDEVVYVTTHNAFNAKYGGSVNYTFPNQNYRVAKQLGDGVRGLMIDVYENSGQLVVYHGFSFTGSEPFANILNEIKLFLDTNPREVITIILECYVTSSQIETAMNNAGLAQYLYSHSPNSQWETLEKIISSGKRLIIFSDKDDAGNLSWYHYLWDYCVETGFSAHSKNELDCNYNRGDSANSLFILNHFITQSLIGTGLPDEANVINSNPFLIDKAKECMHLHGKPPNFLTVDFYNAGNVFDAAKELNGVK